MAKIFLFLLLILFSLLTSAADVSKTNWIKAMSTALPAKFCNPGNYYRQCFDVTMQECKKTAIAVATTCLKNNKKDIPNTLKQPKDGTLWGSVIGVCASRAYEASFMQERIRNEKCDNPNNWQ